MNDDGVEVTSLNVACVDSWSGERERDAFSIPARTKTGGSELDAVFVFESSCVETEGGSMVFLVSPSDCNSLLSLLCFPSGA